MQYLRQRRKYIIDSFRNCDEKIYAISIINFVNITFQILIFHGVTP